MSDRLCLFGDDRMGIKFRGYDMKKNAVLFFLLGIFGICCAMNDKPVVYSKLFQDTPTSIIDLIKKYLSGYEFTMQNYTGDLDYVFLIDNNVGSIFIIENNDQSGKVSLKVKIQALEQEIVRLKEEDSLTRDLMKLVFQNQEKRDKAYDQAWESAVIDPICAAFKKKNQEDLGFDGWGKKATLNKIRKKNIDLAWYRYFTSRVTKYLHTFDKRLDYC
jgi:hypothetical protein